MKTVEDYVWFYYKHGFSIIPLGANGNLKAPSIPKWEQYQTKRASRKEIQNWLDSGLFVGIGIICGNVSGNLAVLDFDDAGIPDEIGIDLDKVMQNGNWVVKTGKGYHIYCRDLNTVKTRKAAIVSMDLKADKGYIVSPPSKHENGNTYTFLNKKFGEIPIQEVNNLFSYIVQKIKDKRGIKPPRARLVKSDSMTPPCISLMKRGVEKGRRNETAYTLASYYKHRMKMPIDDVKALLFSWNNKNKNPMNEDELNQTIESAYTSELEKGCSAIRDLGYCPYETTNDCPYLNKQIDTEKLLVEYGVKDGKKIYYPALAKLIMSQYDYNFLVVKDESTDKKAIYSYHNGFYHRDGREIIRKLVSEFLGDMSTIKAKDEVIDAIIDMSNSYNRGDVEPPKRYINFENGIYDIETGKLLPHSPDFHFLQKVPTQYIPNATCPKILRFIRDVAREDEIPMIQELFGYTLYRGYDVSVVFILFGTGRNGKGVLLKLLRKMVGTENITSRKLQELTNDVFAKADLYGKLANICGEMDANVIKETANLKELTGEDLITAQRKYYGAFQFMNYAKLIFSTNKVPKTNDTSFGLYDRMRVIQFTKLFNASNPKTDVHIYDKISVQEEIEGLVVWSLEGLKRLLKNNAVSGSEQLEDVGSSYEDAVNYEWLWMEENLRVRPDNHVFLSADEIHKVFDDWCIATDHPRVPKQAFTRKLSGYVRSRGGRQSRQRVDGNYLRGYTGVEITSDSYGIVETHDEPEGLLAEIRDATPNTKKALIERFGKEPIEELIEKGLLTRLPNNKLVIDI